MSPNDQIVGDAAAEPDRVPAHIRVELGDPRPPERPVDVRRIVLLAIALCAGVAWAAGLLPLPSLPS